MFPKKFEPRYLGSYKKWIFKRAARRPTKSAQTIIIQRMFNAQHGKRGGSLEMPPWAATTIRDLRRDRSIAPEGDDFANLVTAFLPLVYGSASLLAADNAASVGRIVATVFHAFAVRWRALPRRTVVATWLLQTTGFAAARERQHQRWAVPDATSTAGVNQTLFAALNRLPPAYLNPVSLQCIMGENAPVISRALRVREARVAKLADRGLARLAKALRKKHATAEARPLLAGIAMPVPPEIESLVLGQLHEWSPKAQRNELVRATLHAWQWVGLKRILRRFFVTVSVSLGVLLAVGLTVAWLAWQGYLTAWFIRQSSRQLAKEMPEIAQPARPWPNAAAAQALARRNPPETSAELYGLTNIWTVQLTLTAKQWEGIAPSHVPPVWNIKQPDGTMVLRNPKARRAGLAGVLGLDFNWVEARLDFAGLDFSKVAVRYRGNGTYFNSLFGPKQSFKVDLNKFTKGQNLAGIHTLNFVNAIPDNSYLHDALSEQLFRDLGVPAPRTAYAYLTLDVPGTFTRQPLGLYVLIENIDGDFAANRFGSKTAPIFKPVTPALFKDLGSDWQAYASIYDLKTRAEPEQWDRLIQFARLVTHADDAEFARRLAEYLDLDEFAAFLAGHVLLASYDGFLSNGQNFYLYLDPHSNKFGFIPWDQDHSWGEFGYVATADRRERASIWQPNAQEDHFLQRVLKLEAFRALYRRQLEHALAHHFRSDRLYSQIDHLASLIRPAVAAESDFRLKRFDLSISTHWVKGPRDGEPEGPKAPVHQIKRFIANRITSIRDQLDGQAEGVVLNPNPSH